MNKKMKITVPAILGIIVILFAIPKLRTSNTETNSGPREKRGLNMMQVQSIVIQPGVLDNSIIVTGTVTANEEVELKSEASGKITRIFLKEGAPAKKGDLLVKINDADLQAQLMKATNNKKVAEQKEYRQRMLLEKQGSSQEIYDNVLNEVNQYEAEIQLLKANIAKTEVKAPFDGIIGLKTVSEGSYITPAVKIATLQNISQLKLDFSIPERYFSMVKTGMGVNFTVQGDTNKYSARVYAIEPKIDPATRTILLRAVTTGKTGSVHPGSFAKVVLPLNKISNAFVIPTEALVQDIKGNKVFVYSNGKALSRIVEPGVRKEKELQILKGLNPGDTVITSGVMLLKANQPVKLAQKSSKK